MKTTTDVLPSRENEIATIARLRRRRERDATDDPELIRQVVFELGEFKRNMNKNRRRAGAPPLHLCAGTGAACVAKMEAKGV